MTRDIIRTERIGPVTVIHLQDDRALNALGSAPVSYTHLTLPTTLHECRSRWSPYH